MRRGLLMAFIATLLSARAGFTQGCTSSTASDATIRYCNAVNEAVNILQPRVGIGLSAGNPVAGASSTIGMRLGKVPRITVAGRVTGVYVSLPPIDRVNSSDDTKSVMRSVNIDAAVGLFGGWSLVPTIGGFGSLDLVASAGKLHLPGGAFDDNPTSYAIGARLGILRESFTAPGVSLTGMYRHIGDVTYGDEALTSTDAYFTITDNSVMSLRAIVGKRLFVLGAAAGLGYDRFKSSVEREVRNLPTTTMNDLHQNRMTAFVNVSWTMLILNLVGEGGWQKGGDRFAAPLPAGQSSRSEKSSYYGSLALRLAL